MVTVKTKPIQDNVQDKFDSNGSYKWQAEDGIEERIKRELMIDGC